MTIITFAYVQHRRLHKKQILSFSNPKEIQLSVHFPPRALASSP